MVGNNPDPTNVFEYSQCVTVEDWDVAPQIWKYAITNRLTSSLNEHPLIMTEPAWNPPKNREKTLEVAFEDFDVPAFYLAKSGVCSA